MPLSSLVLAAPRAALALSEPWRRGAVTNARTAAVAVSRQVADRRRLVPHEDDDPGALTRMGTDECWALLGASSVARLAYVARAGVPDIAPVNLAVHGRDLLVRSGPGPKLQAAERREVVAVEVDDVDEQAHTGWSVVAVGRAERLTAAQVQALPLDALPVAWARGPRSAVVRVRAPRVDVRRLH